ARGGTDQEARETMPAVLEPASVLDGNAPSRLELTYRQRTALHVEDEDAGGRTTGDYPQRLSLAQDQPVPSASGGHRPEVPGRAIGECGSHGFRVEVAEPIFRVPGLRSGGRTIHLGFRREAANEVVELDLLVLAQGPQVLPQVGAQSLDGTGAEEVK